MNRLKIWKKQGEYRSFNTGEKMILVLGDKGTTLEPVYKLKVKGPKFNSKQSN